MATTFRASVRAGLFSVLQTYRAANPTLLTGGVYDHRPGSFTPPLAYVGDISEPRITTDHAVRTRHAIGQVVVVHRAADSEWVAGRMDVLVDGLIDAFTAVPHTVANSILTGEMSADDADINYGGHRGASEAGLTYVSTVLSIHVEIHEGRE